MYVCVRDECIYTYKHDDRNRIANKCMGKISPSLSLSYFTHIANTYTHIYIYIYIYMCVCVCVCVSLYISLRLCIYIYIYIERDIYVWTLYYVQMHKENHDRSIYIYICIYKHIKQTYKTYMCVRVRLHVFVCLFVCVYVFMTLEYGAEIL